MSEFRSRVLLADVHLATVTLDVLPRQPYQLALPQTGESRQLDDQPILRIGLVQ